MPLSACKFANSTTSNEAQGIGSINVLSVSCLENDYEPELKKTGHLVRVNRRMTVSSNGESVSFAFLDNPYTPTDDTVYLERFSVPRHKARITGDKNNVLLYLEEVALKITKNGIHSQKVLKNVRISVANGAVHLSANQNSFRRSSKKCSLTFISSK
jgi:hypothetical protein